MTRSIADKIRSLTEKARSLGPQKVKRGTAVRNGSSLHKIIRTKEQADKLMKQLQGN
ncbi:MAG TPA: hypothetical protein VGQ51_10790 [Puia sp.]|nr:hypothetical protein [Puia sp.]